MTLTADAANALSVTATDRAGNVSVAVQVSVTQDSGLDAPVLVDASSPFTNETPITLTGTGTADTDIEILGGAAPATTTCDGNGDFSVAVALNLNTQNSLVARHVGGTTETNVSVTHDNIVPGEPVINPIASPTNQTEVMVTGTTEGFARINITGAVNPVAATANGAGQWSASVTILEDQTTDLSATATDRAGNISLTAANASVTHSGTVPDAPNVDDTNPGDTNQTIHIVTGSVNVATPTVVVNIRGGAADVLSQDVDDVNGTFSVMVTLNTNVVNDLVVTSRDGAIESPPSNVTITHDDILPTDVNDALVTLGSPELSSCIQRVEQIAVNGAASTAEAFSTITVTNTSAAGMPQTSTTANADGSFATTAIVCDGDILSFISTDAASNTSSPTNKSVE